MYQWEWEGGKKYRIAKELLAIRIKTIQNQQNCKMTSFTTLRGDIKTWSLASDEKVRLSIVVFVFKNIRIFQKRFT